MTQADFGALMGQSRRWVQALESGARQGDPRLSVLENAARVLSITLDVLLSDTPKPAVECLDAAELAAIRAALQGHDVITGTADNDPAEPLDVETLHRQVAYGWTMFQASSFAALGRLVPSLLTETNRAAARHTGGDQLAAYRALSMTLQLTEAAAIKFGSTDLAHLAGHRAVLAAERSGDQVIMAAAARHLADAMTHHGQPCAAAEFATAAAARLGRDLVGRGAPGLSTLGMLYLKAAIAQATAADAHDTRVAAAAARAVPDLLDQAGEHAAQLGEAEGGNVLWTAFGAANVALYRVAAHVQLAESAEAIVAALAIPTGALAGLPRERRAHHLADLAHAYTQAGQREKAVDTLLDAEREAAQEVHCRPRSRQLVEDLRLLGAGSAQGRLHGLARRCGLPG